MCGLCGYISINEISKNELSNMTESIKHRGPDHQGTFQSTLNGFHYGLGHRRLSIIDLDERSNQPFLSKDRNIAIVYNGEIYNYEDLKLECQDYEFRTTSDTEVILALYQKFGIDFVYKLIGIFSIALVDTNLNKVFLIRDRHGVKPLYYFNNHDSMVFASELQPIMKYSGFDREIDMESVEMMLALSYTPAPYTVFKNVRKVLPGTLLEFEGSKLTKELNYWNSIKEYRLTKKTNPLLEQYVDELNGAVHRNLISDVDVVTFLSGGVDSSLVTALSRKYKDNLVSYTIGFEQQEYDESTQAKNIADILGVKNKSFVLNLKELVDVALKISDISDDPLGDSSLIPTYLISRAVHLDGKKVVLSGDGGDEFFYGYNMYDSSNQSIAIYKRLQLIPKIMKKFMKPITNTFLGYSLFLSSNLPLFYYAKYSGFSGLFAHKSMIKRSTFSNVMNSHAFLNEVADLTPVEINSLYDKTLYMVDDILMKVDRASMAFSLESRVPLLDHPLSVLSFSSAPHEHVKLGEKKHILKQALRSYLPESLVTGKKKGFSVPVDDILDSEKIKRKILEYSSRDYLERQGLFKSRYIKSVFNSFYVKKNKRYVSYLWNFYCFQAWYEKYMLAGDWA
jgi:asparagine synthase (glutamine-hydrolysing)